MLVSTQYFIIFLVDLFELQIEMMLLSLYDALYLWSFVILQADSLIF